VVVNSAGISAQGAVANVDSKDWRNVIDVNLTGPFLVMKEAIPRLIDAGGGSIINVSSLGGLRSLPGRAAYCSSEGRPHHATQQAALDYGLIRSGATSSAPAVSGQP